MSQWLTQKNQEDTHHHYHHYHGRVAGEGRRVVAPPCPRSTARLQSSPIGRMESFRSWPSHLFRGRPGGRRHVRSGGRFRLGLRPRTRWGSLRCSPRPPSRIGSRMGRGIPPPHTLPPRRLWRLDPRRLAPHAFGVRLPHRG